MNKWNPFICKNTKMWSCVDIQILLGIGTHIYVIPYLLIILFLHSFNKERDRKVIKTFSFYVDNTC